MKTLRCMFACLLLAAFLLTGCGQTVEKTNADTENKQPVTSTEKYPKYYAMLSGLIGKTKAEVLDELDLQESDLEETAPSTDIYYTPMTVQFQGVSFRLVLGFLLGTDTFNSFNYWAAYENDPENAARDAQTIAAYIAEVMDEPDGTGKTPIQDITKENMLEAFTGNKSMTAGYYWKLTEETTQAHKDYIAALEAQSNLLPTGGAYCLEVIINYIKDTNTAHIKLDFGITHDRSTNNEN